LKAIFQKSIENRHRIIGFWKQLEGHFSKSKDTRARIITFATCKLVNLKNT
jgi:hypothetical protein